jgi:hypothetical protein
MVQGAPLAQHQEMARPLQRGALDVYTTRPQKLDQQQEATPRKSRIRS